MFGTWINWIVKTFDYINRVIKCFRFRSTRVRRHTLPSRLSSVIVFVVLGEALRRLFFTNTVTTPSCYRNSSTTLLLLLDQEVEDVIKFNPSILHVQNWRAPVVCEHRAYHTLSSRGVSARRTVATVHTQGEHLYLEI